MREAANASQLKRNFAASELLYVPEVHWDYCRTDVMVMERIHGVPISERSRLQAAGADIAQLAENGVRIFFTQVFRHNFFHADRKSTRLNSSHSQISYAVFCLK